jgi:hypothetical protein
MLKPTYHLISLILLIVSSAVNAQQPPSSPAQAQPAAGSTAPCSKGTQARPHKETWPEKRLKALACAQNKQLCDLPASPSDITGATPDAKPCPPAATSPAPPAPAAPVLHLPNGVITTWLCNPIVTSTDPSHTVTFITPDALTSVEPAQASAFEADGAKADPKATVSCANLRRDPKNNKVFLAQ